jgi:hypothetical protein
MKILDDRIGEEEVRDMVDICMEDILDYLSEDFDLTAQQENFLHNQLYNVIGRFFGLSNDGLSK